MKFGVQDDSDKQCQIRFYFLRDIFRPLEVLKGLKILYVGVKWFVVYGTSTETQSPFKPDHMVKINNLSKQCGLKTQTSVIAQIIEFQKQRSK